MLSTTDLERLIAVKRREIEKEKTHLGLSAHIDDNHNDKQYDDTERSEKQVNSKCVVVSEKNDGTDTKRERDSIKNLYELEEHIPPGLERYIRRYIGLPAMLKAGEYSPNNPLIRGERNTGDVLLALGEYERRRNTLRRLRQQQYKEYLDQQAKKKQEAKELAEKERREREEKERLREERERERLLVEQERRSPVRRPSLNYNNVHASTKVDTGVQVNGLTKPLSVAVQTDDADLYRVCPWPSSCGVTQAERELSPRAAAEHEPPHTPSHHNQRNPTSELPLTSSLVKRSNQEKLLSELRHSYMPSIFDEDAIQLRNMQAEKEAAERRQFYQQELKNQIMEQQRIKEERKSREKLLEQAEMRRLEEQLRMLRMAQDREVGKQLHLDNQMTENTIEYNNKRTELQKEIDSEQQKCRVKTQQMRKKHNTTTDNPTKLPPQYPRTDKNKPYSINISDNSLFSPNYDVESYLRRNLNYNMKEDKNQNYLKNDFSPANDDSIPVLKHSPVNTENDKNKNYYKKDYSANDDPIPILKHLSVNTEQNKRYLKKDYSPASDNSIPNLKHSAIINKRNTDNKNKKYLKKDLTQASDDSIPILKHSPVINTGIADNNNLSDAMRKVDDKWKVPAVQKNLLKSLPNDEGKNISILTQLGSIRRQLQLEQLKLDQMLPKEDA